MAKSKENTATAPTRSDVIEVSDTKMAAALIAAWQGIYHFFGGRVEEWEVLTPSEDLPDGGLVAHGFSVDGKYDPNRILSDINVRDRRVGLFPAHSYLTNPDAVPPPFTDAKQMTAWSVQFLRGAVEEGTARTPEYARDAIGEYKANQGLAVRRGRQRKIFRLDEITNLDEKAIRSIPPEQLQEFLAKANAVISNPVNTGGDVPAEAASA